MPEIGETLRVTSRRAWRAWLDRHGATKREIWLLLAKVHVPPPRLTYEEAIEEALCVGWIDGIIKRFDEDHRALRFSPRKKESVWSEPNKRRVRRLQREGRMVESGLALVRLARRTGTWTVLKRKTDTRRLPPDLTRALREVPGAQAYFQGLAPGYRRLALLWVSEAKRPETRARRVAEVARRAGRGERVF